MTTMRDCTAETFDAWPLARERWAALVSGGVPTPFQSLAWLDRWYATLGAAADVEPLIVFLRRDGRDRLGLPLIRRRESALRVIEFADGGLTDYNAPALAADAQDVIGPDAALRALRAALPPADLLRLTKMPRRLGARANPLATGSRATACRLAGNLLTIDGDWLDWRSGLERTVRKELERSLRVFERSAGARFVRARDAAEGRRLLDELARMQRARIAALGLPYALDEPRNARFYEQLVEHGLESGAIVVTALEAEGECVAALLGVAAGDHYAMVRLGQAGGRWRNCSPGRLMIDQTMRALRAEGVTRFDFTIGDYDYKRRLQVTRVELADLTSSLSWRGAPLAAGVVARARLRASPLVAGALAALRRPSLAVQGAAAVLVC
ncbi:MAG: GNAT family N-acetyltransferase [Methylobacteriaceae bacterium]|nr:GNAT family N-acetyltransferase [Methylobacteriaceae bacterium]